MSAVLFFDPACNRPYSTRTLEETALGGTEATVTRIADALGARVMQHNRSSAEGRYLPPGAATDVRHLIVLRDPRPLRRVAASFPGARVYLWLHDLSRPGSKRGRRLAAAARVLSELAVTIVCVSDFQRRQVEAVLQRARAGPRVRAVTIYNPVDTSVEAVGSPVDSSKLVFFSSPNKGLAFTLDAFGAARRVLPDLRLRIGSPGYRSPERAGIASDGRLAGVEWLGALPHARILEEVRTALCVFYPNFVLPETFGLVLAEAQAVGTPVITHDCGAVREILADPSQILPVTRAERTYERIASLLPSGARHWLAAGADRLGVFAPYVERLLALRAGERPAPHPDPRFRLDLVAQRWRALLSDKWF
jgi:glycosyltransferase involved in cell wall biosynthesis